MINGLIEMFLFLFEFVFGSFIILLWLVLMMRFFRVSNLHPTFAAISKYTTPITSPFEALIGRAGTLSQRIDWPSLIVLIITEFIRVMVIGLLRAKALPSLKLLSSVIFVDLLIQPIDILFYAVLARALISWFKPTWHNPIVEILRVITEPLFQPIRKYVPVSGGIDFSPLVVLILLKGVSIFILSTFSPYLM